MSVVAPKVSWIYKGRWYNIVVVEHSKRYLFSYYLFSSKIYRFKLEGLQRTDYLSTSASSLRLNLCGQVHRYTPELGL